MKKLFSILLLGALSMLFAEVFSGASTLWFIDPWGLLVTFPLYLAHTVFFFSVAFLFHKTSLRQLYFFGMMFGLYEALITKVLWFGYPQSSSPVIGSFFGVVWGEFLTLVFFWHPVMSFLLPVFVYEVLSDDFLPGHIRFLQKNKKTFFLVGVLIVMGASFQSNGAQYDILRSIGSMGGSLLIVILLHVLTKGKNLQDLVLGKKAMILTIGYLIFLYTTATLFILPERLPHSVLPYLLILLWYLIIIGLLWVDRYSPENSVLSRTVFTPRDLGMLALLTFVATGIFSLLPPVTYGVLLVMFISLIGVGVVLFFWALLSLIRQRMNNNPVRDEN
jgi:hypothetical protein